jgi:polyhydroxyalkanoate synthase subunit PhaC
VKLPVCAIACETDHIAHWRGSFNGIKQMGSKDKTFLLSESGHIAGIINPPSKDKYGHYTNDAPVAGDPEAWLKSATFHKGSWWPRWGAWLASHSGPMIKARIPGDSLAPAPGTYVVATPEL